VNRRASHTRGYDRQWRNARERFLREHPLCVFCLREDRYKTATVVDHVIPHRGNSDLFWNLKNWQPLCKRCHDRKTASGQ
jgi:5-methylcytosine-specific restriction enzyme A